ncbi:hypothetical protein F0L74_23720 [Chitinophaga agrisoli]|uniref:Uncharacterized protein n=1 Tax=Chitinophaga agrisoli TaxID=2607653 RepID=A0A5B2VKK5_9BACT|nr:hypothetical protein [Chitinophaga agrisoli]KAA2239218.1 hypothetical protein F0L74_23720 [Chitinophaga agrisoli]
MDEVHDRLQQFQRNLEIFNDKLKVSFDQLTRYHETVHPWWQDSMRNEYEIRWKPLEDKMKQYVTTDGNNYSDILLHKINLIKRYLHGW